ncbi:histone deacetylase [Pelagibacteraceae bacterium]|nr:histone deacetylase [Pelagibacteraceae bacterium]
MKKLSWITHPQYDIALPKNHKFTASKFSDLFKCLQIKDFYSRSNILEPNKASIEELELVHDRKYILKILNGTLTDKEIRRLGFNWSEVLSNRSFLAVNGTLLTCKEALKNGIANHLAGGTHHSHRNFGSGYCVFNDMAYASKSLINSKLVKKVLIFDTDVHQGDGTAEILKSEKNIFTCSIHCINNFPFQKSKSDLDINLDDNLEDKDYLDIVNKTLIDCLRKFDPEIVIYDAGVDIHKDDKLGNLNISSEGLFKRDLLVLSFFKNHSIPVATVIGGGYSDDNAELAKRHSIIFEASDKIF